MRRYVKVLAAGTLLSTQASPSYVSVATAQVSQLPPVTISGSSSSGGGCGSNCNPYGGFYSGGGKSSSADVPENEASSRTPAPPPPPAPKKTPEQKEQERQACEKTRTENVEILTTSHNGMLGVCASRQSTYVGFFVEEAKRLIRQNWSIGPGDCAAQLTAAYGEMVGVYNRRRDQCVATAMKD